MSRCHIGDVPLVLVLVLALLLLLELLVLLVLLATGCCWAYYHVVRGTTYDVVLRTTHIAHDGTCHIPCTTGTTSPVVPLAVLQATNNEHKHKPGAWSADVEGGARVASRARGAWRVARGRGRGRARRPASGK